MRRPPSALLASTLLLAAALPAPAGDGSGFVTRVHQGADGPRKYVVFVPHDYAGDKEVPCILFLHGAGERGDDGLKPVTQGLGNAIKFKDGEKTFPFLVVFPQCRPKGKWQADSTDGKEAMAILDDVMKAYKVDARRVYLTGLSLGGYGTWSLAAAHPDRWAAIAPICGGGDPATAEKIKHLPCWCFHGAEDQAVKVRKSREMIDALKAAGAAPRYSEYLYVAHNSWDPAYTTPELYPWLLSHARKD